MSVVVNNASAAISGRGSNSIFVARRWTVSSVTNSEGGARLVVSESVTMPAEFDLTFMDRTRVQRVELAWRKGDQLGVRSIKAAA